MDISSVIQESSIATSQGTVSISCPTPPPVLNFDTVSNDDDEHIESDFSESEDSLSSCSEKFDTVENGASNLQNNVSNLQNSFLNFQFRRSNTAMDNFSSDWDSIREELRCSLSEAVPISKNEDYAGTGT